MSVRLISRLLPSTLGVLALSGCFTTTADFRAEAETFILDDEGVAEGLGVALVSATCDEPADQEVGTVFDCTAIDANGDEWGFEVEIAESDSIDVSVSERP
ncbi:MAG TPA: hypothetical protein VES40_05725 [Ilumatobacteraceae bacterium]|nr:hypothetical protein [Ilumatobacteraceae bacterium]